MDFRHVRMAKGVMNPMMLFGIALLAILVIADFYLSGGLDASRRQTDTPNNTATNTARFDFDGGIPVITAGLSTPFNYSTPWTEAWMSSILAGEGWHNR